MREVVMGIPFLKKRLHALEKQAGSEGKGIIKAFIYHAEAPEPFWSPEHPVAWMRANPKGIPVILKMLDCANPENSIFHSKNA